MHFVRLFICALIASVLVFVFASIGVRWFYEPEQEGEATMLLMRQINLTGLFEGEGGEERRRQAERDFVREGPEPSRRPEAPVEIPEREVSGFVQVEFTVFPDGTVEDVEVVGAQPSGVYEDQARARVRARDYTGQVSPAEQDGERRTEVIDFTVPASELDND